MRPSVMALVQKLREMKTLRHPNGNVDSAVVHLIADDLIHHYFVREGKIDDVFTHLVRINSYWRRLMGDHGLDEMIGTEDTAFPYPDQLPLPVAPDTHYSVLDKIGSKESRAGVEHLIYRHYPKMKPALLGFECGCGKIFNSREEWATHLRIRIYRYMEDVFAPDEEADQASSPVTST
jgi:hypothetical protein